MKEKKEMSFLGHLEELRWLLVRSTIAVLIAGTATFFVSDFVFDQIIFGPTDVNFVTYHYFCELAQYFQLGDDLCIKEMPFIIQNTEMEGQVNILVWTCVTSGFILAFPYILWQVWKFVRPALYEKERRGAVGFMIASTLLFFLGVLFGYYIVVPMSVNFFATFQVSDKVVNHFSLDSYISMIKTSVIASGLFFELPIVIFFLTKLGLVSADMLRKYRKYAIVIVLIVAAIVTPPDVVTQVIVSIPMLLIYEASIFIAASVERRAQKTAL